MIRVPQAGKKYLAAPPSGPMCAISIKEINNEGKVAIAWDDGTSATVEITDFAPPAGRPTVKPKYLLLNEIRLDQTVVMKSGNLMDIGGCIDWDDVPYAATVGIPELLKERSIAERHDDYEEASRINELIKRLQNGF